MKRKTFTLLALAMLITGFYAPPVHAYFRTIEGVNNLQTPNVIPSRYYNTGIPRYRSQTGRSTAPSSPATGNYNRRTSTSVASSKMARGSIRSLFGRVGLSQDNTFPSYDNNQFNDSKIKFRTLVSHICFEPVGSEIDRCKKRFGEFYNLKESILNGSVYTILVENNPNISKNIQPLYQKMVAEIQKNDAPVIITQAAESKILLRDRMQIVWDACKQQTANRMEAAKCYIRNDRQYLDNNVLNANSNFLR